MTDSFQQVETAFTTGESVQAILQIFEAMYINEVDYEDHQVKLINKAIEYGKKDLLQYLIKKEWPFEPVPAYSQNFTLKFHSPLYTACNEDKYELVKLLLDHGVCVNSDVFRTCKPKEYVPIKPIMEQDNVDLLKLILPHYKVQYNVTPLHLACFLGAEKCAAFLVEGKYFAHDHKTDINEVPLQIAVRSSIAITKLLVQQGAKLHDVYDGKTLIFHSLLPNWYRCQTSFDPRFLPDLIKFLIDGGAADVNVTYHNITLLNPFFVQIQRLQKVVLKDDVRVLERCDKYWIGLKEAAQMVLEAGLKVNEVNLISTYALTFKCVWSWSTMARGRHPNFEEVTVVRPLKWSYELFQLFHDKKTFDINVDVIYSTLCYFKKMMKYLVPRFLLEKSYQICKVVYDILRHHFLNVDRKITSKRTNALLDIFQTVRSDAEPILKLLNMLTLFIAVEKLHELQGIAPYVVLNRFSLACQAKMAVISSVQVPREENIKSLELPTIIKDILLLRD